MAAATIAELPSGVNTTHALDRVDVEDDSFGLDAEEEACELVLDDSPRPELPEYSSTYHVTRAEKVARDVLEPVALGLLVDVSACGRPGHVLALYAYARRVVPDLLATREALLGARPAHAAPGGGADDARVVPVGEFVCAALAAARRFTVLADDLGDRPLLFPLLRWREHGGRGRQWATVVVAAQPAGQPMLVHVPRSPFKRMSRAATMLVRRVQHAARERVARTVPVPRRTASYWPAQALRRPMVLHSPSSWLALTSSAWTYRHCSSGWAYCQSWTLFQRQG